MVLPEIVTIPTGIDLGKYSLSSSWEVKDFRRRYADDDEILLISVCRLSGEKNIDFMIDGLRKVRERTSVSFRCILVGDGPERAHLEEKAAENGLADRIFFTGALLPMEVVRAYLASDLFVFSSRSETQGMVLVEAMAGGCPVVAVNSSGVHDVVEDGYNGFKVPANLENWTRSIVILLHDRELLGTLSRNSRDFARKYSGDEITEKVLALYHRTLLESKGVNASSIGEKLHQYQQKAESKIWNLESRF